MTTKYELQVRVDELTLQIKRRVATIEQVMKEVHGCIEDPMWGEHPDISKATLERWHNMLRQAKE